MTKNRKVIIALSVALLFAILAGVSAYLFMAPKRSTVYVFNAPYSAGTKLESSMLTPVQADSTIVVAGQKYGTGSRFVTQEEVTEILKTGDSLRMDVIEGMPLMTSMLSVTGGNAIEMAMSPSGIAITVEVNSITGVTDELAPGAHVNVYATGAAGSTYLVFENMRILQVSRTQSGALHSATLEVNNEEALKLVNVSQGSTLYLGLVNGSGYQYVQKEPISPMPDVSKNDVEQKSETTEKKPDNKADFSVKEGN